MHTLKVMYADGSMEVLPCYSMTSERNGDGYFLEVETDNGLQEVDLLEGDVAYLMAGKENVHVFRAKGDSQP